MIVGSKKLRKDLHSLGIQREIPVLGFEDQFWRHQEFDSSIFGLGHSYKPNKRIEREFSGT
jgi:hypothetical protein